MTQRKENKALSLKQLYGANLGIGNHNNEFKYNSVYDIKQISLNPNEGNNPNLRITKMLNKENNKLKILIHKLLEQELNERKVLNTNAISKFKTSGFKKIRRKSNLSVNPEVKISTDVDREQVRVEAQKTYIKKKKSIKMIFSEGIDNESLHSSNNSSKMNSSKNKQTLEAKFIEKKLSTIKDDMLSTSKKNDLYSFKGNNLIEESNEDKDKGLNNKQPSINNLTFPKIEKKHRHSKNDKKRVLRKPQRIVDSIEDIQDEDKLDLTSPYFIPPNCSFKRLWDVLMSLITLYILIIEPLYIAFGTISNSTVNFLEILMDFLFIVDLIFNFFIPYIDQEDEMVCNHKMIAKNYVTGWFGFDLLSSIPSSTIIFFIEETNLHTNKIIVNVQLIKFSRLYKVLKLTRVFKFVENFGEKKLINNKLDFIETLNLSSAKKRMLSFVFTFLLSTHILCCLWIFLAVVNPGLNWISQFELTDYKSYEIYITSIYFIWASVFTVGYGDIYPVNSIERIFSILIMMIGVLIYSYAVSSLGNMITTYDNITTRYMTNMNILNELRNRYPSMNNEEPQDLEKNYEMDHQEKEKREILKEKTQTIVENLIKKDTTMQSFIKKPSVKLNLYDKLSRFFKYDYLSNKFEKLNFIQELPFNIRNELLFKMYENIFTSFPFFKFSFGSDVNYSFNARIILSMKPIKVYKHEYIITEGEYVEEMFLVNYGVLSVELGIKYDFNSILVLRKFDHFGDIMVLSNEKSELNVKVKSLVAELYLIKKKDLFDISFEFPEIFKEIYRISKRNYLKLKNIIEIRKIKKDKNIHLKQLMKRTNFIRKPDKNRRGVVFKSYENETQDLSNNIISYCKQLWDNNLSEELNNPSLINEFQSCNELISKNNLIKDQVSPIVNDNPLQFGNIGVFKKLEDTITYTKKINKLCHEEKMNNQISFFRGNNEDDLSNIINSSNNKNDILTIDNTEKNKLNLSNDDKYWKKNLEKHSKKNKKNNIIFPCVENSSSTSHFSKMNSKIHSQLDNINTQQPLNNSSNITKEQDNELPRFGRLFIRRSSIKRKKISMKIRSNENLPCVLDKSIRSLKLFDKKNYAISLSKNIRNNLLDNLEIGNETEKIFL